MQGKTRNMDEHIGELLSGYIDGELTQQERQRVELHCDACQVCTKELEDLREVRGRVGSARLGEYGEDKWREMMDDTTVTTARGIGWLLVVGGLIAIGGVGVYEFTTDPSIAMYMKVIIGAIYGGAALLFISVLRQRLVERKSDKYKDVEI